MLPRRLDLREDVFSILHRHHSQECLVIKPMLEHGASSLDCPRRELSILRRGGV
jgi:hypothetical protein